jgi:hypothetical protein
MRAVNPIVPNDLPGLVRKVSEICFASQDVTEEIADAFTLGTFTETRTLNPATATATDIANVLATFLNDMKNRGTTRRV